METDLPAHDLDVKAMTPIVQVKQHVKDSVRLHMHEHQQQIAQKAPIIYHSHELPSFDPHISSKFSICGLSQPNYAERSKRLYPAAYDLLWPIVRQLQETATPTKAASATFLTACKTTPRCCSLARSA